MSDSNGVCTKMLLLCINVGYWTLHEYNRVVQNWNEKPDIAKHMVGAKYIESFGHKVL